MNPLNRASHTLKEQYPAALKYCPTHRTIGVMIGEDLPCCLIASLKGKLKSSEEIRAAEKKLLIQEIEQHTSLDAEVERLKAGYIFLADLKVSAKDAPISAEMISIVNDYARKILEEGTIGAGRRKT